MHVGVVPATGGVTRWLDLGETRGSLIARVHWTPDSARLLVERMNRIQNHLDLFSADASSGTSRAILSESDPYWINHNDLFQFIGKDEFLWGSERDGFCHLYLYSLDGQQRKRLTEGNWEVTEVAGVDEAQQKVYFVSTEASPLERELYSVKLNGKDRVRVSRQPGTHAISMGPTAEYYLDTFSASNEPPKSDLYAISGEEWATFRPAKRALADDYALQQGEVMQLKAQDGKQLYARLIKPANFCPGQKYPAVVVVYGGPGAQTVVNDWRGPTWINCWQQRGSSSGSWIIGDRPGGGTLFETPLFRRFGKTGAVGSTRRCQIPDSARLRRSGAGWRFTAGAMAAS